MKRLNLFALGLLAFLLAVPQGAHAAGFTFLSTVGDQTFYVGTPASVTLPQVDPNSDDSISPCHHRDTTYSISPALPPGLSFAGGQGSNSSTTLILSGTPTQATAQTEYTYTGQENNCYVTATATFNITVEAAKVSLSKSSVGLTEGGDTATYNVKLGSAPTADVTVTVTSGDSDAVTVTPSSLTFNTTDYSTNQTVTVTPVNDEDGADETVTVTHSASGGGFDGESSALTATVTDDDKGITITPSSLSVFEGGSSKTYSMALAAQPSGNVTVSPSSNPTIDTRSTTAPSTLTFTKNNWNVHQTVTVRPLNDLDNFNHSSSRTYKAFGGGYGSGTVTGAITISVKESFRCSDQSTDDMKADCAVLETLYDDTGGANWTNKTNWKDSDTLDQWHGITVSGGRVSEIELYENQLTGTIPSDISNLSGLNKLDLGGNSLSGTIPSGLSSLANLWTLFLDGNSLSGSIPDLSSSTNLGSLYLDNNQLNGTIPVWLNNMDLSYLRLHDNRLTGAIPDLSGLDRLRNLDLSNNRLSGQIPQAEAMPGGLSGGQSGGERSAGAQANATGNLPNTGRLDLSNNSISGTIPDLSDLDVVYDLNFSRNRLGGELNASHLPTKSVWIDLSDNRLSGTIPDLSSLSRLAVINLSGNNFSGTIPDMSSVRDDINLSGNSLSGGIDQDDFYSYLYVLYLNDNKLTGSVNLSGMHNLKVFGFWGNPGLTLSNASLHSDVSGSEIDRSALDWMYSRNGGPGWTNNTNWPNSSYLGAADLNSWHGVTTAGDGRVSVLNLSSNNLTGEISGSIEVLTSLTELNLSGNGNLSGTVPLRLKDISGLTTVNLSGTKICLPSDQSFTTWKNGITFTEGSCAQGGGQSSSPPSSPPAGEQGGGTGENETKEEKQQSEDQGGAGQGGGNGENEAKEDEEPVVPAEGNTEAGGCALVSGEEPPGAGPELLLFAAVLLAASRLRRRGSGKIHGGRAAAGRGVVNLPLQK